MKDQWHSVNDQLPEKGLWLVYGPSETGPPTMRVDEYDGEWGWTGPLSVTHWRELPLPPEYIRGVVVPGQPAVDAPQPELFLPAGFKLLLDKVVIDGLTSLDIVTKRDGCHYLVTVSVGLDTAASPYPFLEKAEADDDVVLEIHEPLERITGTGQITGATALGFVWSGTEAVCSGRRVKNPDARKPRQCTVHECELICVHENKGKSNERWACPVHGLVAWPA